MKKSTNTKPLTVNYGQYPFLQQIFEQQNKDNVYNEKFKIKRPSICMNSDKLLSKQVQLGCHQSILRNSIPQKTYKNYSFSQKILLSINSEQPIAMQQEQDNQKKYSLHRFIQVSELDNHSHILNDFQQIQVFFDEKVEFQLLYRASNFSFSATRFHQICDQYTNTIVICKTKNHQIIGGFTPLSWKQQFSQTSTHFKTDRQNLTFLFSVSRNQKYPLKPSNKNKAICCYKGWGPTFGGGYDLQIGDRANAQYTSLSYFPRNFMCQNNKEANMRYLTGSRINQFKLVQWEVYKVNKSKIKDQTTNTASQIDQSQFGFNLYQTIKKGIINKFFSFDKKQSQC